MADRAETPEVELSYPRIEVTKGMAGWFAVKMHWNHEDGIPGGFPEPYGTGGGRYALQSEAIEEAKAWAEGEGIPFLAPHPDPTPARQDVEAQIKEIIPDVKIIHLKGPFDGSEN